MSSILIKNAYIASMVSPISKADLLIIDNRIAEIGIIEKEADKVIDATGKVVMPGLINGHTHVGMSVFRGFSDDLELMQWLQGIWKVEDKMTAEQMYYATLLSELEMIKSGTTTYNDQYFFEEDIAKATEVGGMRAILSRCIMRSEEQAERRINEAKSLYENWNGACNGRITQAIGIHSPYTCPPQTIIDSVKLAKEYNLPIHTHYLETEDEIKQIRENYNKTSTEYYRDLGVFDVPVILAHGVHMNDDDIDFLKTLKCGIIHNPISNQKLGSGVCDVRKLLDNGIPVGLGTDGQCSTNTLDMFEEMKSAAYLQKVTYKKANAISAFEVLKMATIDGARALGLENEIGSLEVGKKADIIIVDLDKPHLCPVHDIYSTLAYSANGSDVETVIIDGNIVMEDRKVLTMDEKAIMDKCNELVKELFE